MTKKARRNITRKPRSFTECFWICLMYRLCTRFLILPWDWLASQTFVSQLTTITYQPKTSKARIQTLSLETRGMWRSHCPRLIETLDSKTVHPQRYIDHRREHRWTRTGNKGLNVRVEGGWGCSNVCFHMDSLFCSRTNSTQTQRFCRNNIVTIYLN